MNKYIQEFRKAVDEITKNTENLRDIDLGLKLFNPDEISTRQDVITILENIAVEMANYLNTITPYKIRQILIETDNAVKRTADLAKIKRISNTINGVLQNLVINTLNFNIPQPNHQRFIKTINGIPDICLIPKEKGKAAGYNLKNDIIYLYILNEDGTYNPIDLINSIANNSIKNAIEHEMTHQIDWTDSKAAGKSFKITKTTNTPEYSNNDNEINAITNQIITYIENDLKQTATNIRTIKSKPYKIYPWPNAITDGINLLLSDLYKTDFKNTLNNMSDENLHRMYRTIYEYFYKQLLNQYKIDNPDQYNAELKQLDKFNK